MINNCTPDTDNLQKQQNRNKAIATAQLNKRGLQNLTFRNNFEAKNRPY